MNTDEPNYIIDGFSLNTISSDDEWALIYSLLGSGRLFIHEETLEEISCFSPDLGEAISQYSSAIILRANPHDGVAYAFAEKHLVASKASLTMTGPEFWIIAAAHVEGLTVVTDQIPTRPLCLPVLCRAEKIPYLNLVDLIMKEQ